MSKIRQWLQAGNTLDQLLEYGVKHRRHKDYPNLVLLKYEITAKWTEPMVHECRGIVLDEDDSYRVVCRAFDKFWNAGEFYAADIDWSTARVQEKLDGSLATLYSYRGQWHVATTGTPDASGPVNATETSFHDYFMWTFLAQGGSLPDVKRYGHLCFSFELMGPANRIVVVHEKPHVRLLAIRDRETGEQFGALDCWADILGIEAVRSFPLQSLKDIEASFQTMSPLSQEGYVIVDGKFNRVKVKHPGYVALHHAKDGMGPKAYVEIARSGDVSEVAVHFPEFKPLIEAAVEKYQRLVSRTEATFAEIKSLPTQKEFAFEAVKAPCSSALFQARKGKPIAEFFREADIDKVMTWMQAA